MGFRKDFLWGGAVSANQCEGGHDEGGRGLANVDLMPTGKDRYLIGTGRMKMYDFDKSFGEYKYLACVDEVGRGPLAGPIVACAVILEEKDIDDNLILWLNDSKKISEKKRES